MRIIIALVASMFMATAASAVPGFDTHEMSGTYKVIACAPDCENSYAGSTRLSDITQLTISVQVNLDLITCDNQGAFEFNISGSFGSNYYNNFAADQICDGKFSQAADRVRFVSPSGVELTLRKGGGDRYTFRWLEERFVNKADATLTLQRLEQ